MPQAFAKLGVTFLYPDNWTLEEEDDPAGPESVTVYSPGGAFWSLSAHPPETDPQDLAESAVEAMREEYKQIETEPAVLANSDCDLVGFDLAFYYLDLTNTACIRCFGTDDACYAVFYQAEDREFQQFEQGFQAMTRSLLDSVT